MTIYDHEVWKQLDAVERAAIEKRYLGKSYAKIEEELADEFGESGFAASTLKTYFSEGGRLFEVYIWYATKTNEQRDKEAKVYWESCIMNAVGVVIDVLNDEKNPRRLAAALAIIESVWGKPYQKVELSGELSVHDKYKDMTIEEIRARLDDIRREMWREQGDGYIETLIAEELARAEKEYQEDIADINGMRERLKPY